MGDEAEEKNGSIHFMTLFNRQGKTRLAKWCAGGRIARQREASHERLAGMREGGGSQGSGSGWSVAFAQRWLLV
jgi:hypothetical protein